MCAIRGVARLARQRESVRASGNPGARGVAAVRARDELEALLPGLRTIAGETRVRLPCNRPGRRWRAIADSVDEPGAGARAAGATTQHPRTQLGWDDGLGL